MAAEEDQLRVARTRIEEARRNVTAAIAPLDGARRGGELAGELADVVLAFAELFVFVLALAERLIFIVEGGR